MRRNAATALLVALLTACSDGSDFNFPDSHPFDGYGSAIYGDSANWLCHPSLGAGENVCAANLDATRVYADGSTEIEPFLPAADPQVDCFYIYPTYSTDAGANSDLQAGPGEIYAALSQAARYSRFCRVFAPVYRQTTISALFSGVEPDFSSAYEDVLDSFKHYVANDNKGRGFILIGHSQGSVHLQRLIAQTIETDEYLLRHMIAAHLLGTSVHTPEGVDTGGEFQRVPVCRTPDQTACVISYSTYRATDAYLAAGQVLFGAPLDGEPAICTNPAALSGGSAELSSYFPLVPDPVLESLIVARANGPFAIPAGAPAITTPFYSVPGLVRGECAVNAQGISYLEISVNADPSDPRADDINGEFLGGTRFGMHLEDMVLAMGDLVALGESQARAWLQDH